MGTLFLRRCGRRLGPILFACGVAIGNPVFASPVSAHGDGETTEGYLLVQQALGHLAHDTTSQGIVIATEKLNDALNTKDQSGINIAELRQAKVDLQSGQVDPARALLQRSISGATSQLKPAAGEGTGTTAVLLPEPGRGPLSVADGGLVVVFALLLFLGVALAWYFRPHDNMHVLRRRLGPPRRAVSDDRTEPTSEDSPSLR